MKIQAPKGTRDFYPSEMAIRNWIADQWQAVSRRSGFSEYDGPIFESLDLYRKKSGDEIVSQLFHFRDRGDREFAIRPEMTPTLARMVAAKAHTLAKPIKWFSRSRLCRAERPQRGRLREFFQWNIDIVGEEDEIADAECVFVAIDFFRSIGLTPDHVEVKLNSRAIIAALLRKLQVTDDRLAAVYAALDKREKLSPEAFRESLENINLDAGQIESLCRISEARGPEGLSRIRELLAGDDVGIRCCESVDRVFAQLNDFGVADYCVYDMGIVRGLAYYTGIVFEAFGKGGLKRAICGGGRYDRLVSDLGGPAMGCVGFATSDVVVQDLLEDMGLLPDLSSTIDYFVIDSQPSLLNAVLDAVSRLRHRGVAADFSYKRQSVNKQFKQAAVRGCRRVLVIEPDSHDTGRVTVKDMVQRTQGTVLLDELMNDPWRPIGDQQA